MNTHICMYNLECYLTFAHMCMACPTPFDTAALQPPNPRLREKS